MYVCMYVHVFVLTWEQWSPLIFSVMHHHYVVLHLLIEAGADPNIRDDRGVSYISLCMYGCMYV